MAARLLSAKSVSGAKPRAKPYKLYDGAGLMLLVTPGGARYWRWKYRFGGREKLLALGVYPTVELKEARDLREAAEKLRDAGTDPSTVLSRREKRLRERAAQTSSVEAVAREWHSKQKKWTPGHADDVMRSLKADVFPTLGPRPIASITRQDVVDALARVERRGAIDIAHRVKQRISAVMRYALQTGRIERNPAADMKNVLTTREKRHLPALPVEHVPLFLAKLADYRGDWTTKYAMKLAMLTAVRPGEVRFARWSEFDLEGATWTIPAERMKRRLEHLVPLSRQAVELLRELRRDHGHTALLFPGRVDESKPISENTLTGAMKRMGFAGRATAHGFRATFSTALNEHGFNQDWIERQLAHVPENEVRATYNRAKYLEGRRQLMQWWADHLDGLCAPPSPGAADRAPEPIAEAA